MEIKSFPPAIIHIDGDSFFASCEVARRPDLRGKPVVTGAEKGIVSAMTYEAKARGIHRGMILSDVRKVCPDAVIIHSDYHMYGLYAERMYAIVRRYAREVEPYSIDECFGDLSGEDVRQSLCYEEIARRIQRDLTEELGMSFSIGLAPSKVLAKVASKWKKPQGFTVIRSESKDAYLRDTPIGKVWGIGGSTSEQMRKLDIKTAYDLAETSEAWAEEHLSKPYQEIRYELQGIPISRVHPESRMYQSIMKTRTFRPPSASKGFVFAQLSKNVERATEKLRRHGLVAREMSMHLKTDEFTYARTEFILPRPTSSPFTILEAVYPEFERLYRPGIVYRATGVTLRGIRDSFHVERDLFGSSLREERFEKIHSALDLLSVKHGMYSVCFLSSLRAFQAIEVKGEGVRAKIERIKRARLRIPFLGFTV